MFFHDIAQSPWTDGGRIYASRRLGMSDAKKSSASDAKQRVKHAIFESDAASAKHAGSARAISQIVSRYKSNACDAFYTDSG